MLIRMWRKWNPCIKLPYGSTIPLLGIYPEKTIQLPQRYICTPMLWQHYSQ